MRVRAGQRKTVRFVLGPGVSQSVTRAERISNLVVLGFRFGAIIALSSIGLSLVYGISKLVNFAHGELVTLGAVMAFLFSASGAGPGWHLLVAVVPAMLAVGAFGGVLELGLWRPLRRRRTGNVALILVSIGLSLMIRYLIVVIFGRRPRSYLHYNISSASCRSAGGASACGAPTSRVSRRTTAWRRAWATCRSCRTSLPT